MAGIGLPRASDRSQIMKWEAFLRSAAVRRDAQDTVNALFNRIPAPQNAPHTPIRYLKAPAPSLWPKRCYLTARSLMEWAAESGLQLANRVYVTPDEERRRIQFNCTLEELAKELLLWPDLELYPEDEPLLEIDYFATDGSFTVQPQSMVDILTPEDLLRAQGKGSGGIVFVTPDPNRRPIAVRITSSSPEPGMNAYTWELVTQLVALQLMKHKPAHITGYSDCTSAIARTCRALTTTYDKQAHERGGLWASAIYHSRPSQEPRNIEHVKAHPERCTKRTRHPTKQDKAIFMADAVASGEYNPKLGPLHLPMEPHTLVLEHILEELLPVNHWHFRTLDEECIPILNDIVDFQHHAQLRRMTTQRDCSNDENRWTSTALAFASKIHPPKNTSFWAAARRALIIFDWMGHGRNKAKQIDPSTVHHAQVAKCPHCPALDSQAHSMLDCPHRPFTSIRRKAKIKQAAIATRLMAKPGTSDVLIDFIKTLCHACWTPSPQTNRLWLGTWQLTTLRSLLGHEVEQPISMKERHQYISVIHDLTAPLLHAYDQITDININKTQGYHRPQHHIEFNHDNDQVNTPRAVAQRSFNQVPPANGRPPGIHNLTQLQLSHLYAISDAACSATSADRPF